MEKQEKKKKKKWVRKSVLCEAMKIILNCRLNYHFIFKEMKVDKSLHSGINFSTC